MGCISSTPSGTPEDRQRQKDIEEQLRRDRKALESEVKLLLLGAGESGKSTIAKQMKIIHLDGFSKEERLSYKDIIHSNIITSSRVLSRAAESVDQKYRDTVDELVAVGEVKPEHVGVLQEFWATPEIQKAYERRSDFQLNDSTAYYFENCERIAQADYLPTEQDVLRARAKTTGITETQFEVDETRFKMVDVGGQRSERKKWIHCFQDVTAVIFCVALSEYNLKLYEDATVNRMHESIKLFDEICNSKWFASTSVVLFLNKKDLFEEKIASIDLNVCFPEYTGGCNYDAGSKFIEKRFIGLNRNPAEKHVYPHITCATDTENIRFVFNAVKDIILHQALDASGF